MTFVLYPMLRFQEIVKGLNATESFVFEDGIVRSMPNKLKWKSSKLLPIYLRSH